MAQIELKLSARVQKETGMREVMIRFVQGWKFNARAKSGIFVSPDYFEYYIDRTKTEKAGIKVPNSLMTITTERADQKHYFLRESGLVVIKQRLETPDVKYHREQANRLDELKKVIIAAYESNREAEITSEWLQLVVNKYVHPENFVIKNEDKKSFYELVEDYIVKRQLAESHARVYRVLSREVARFEGFIRATEYKFKDFTFDVDTINKHIIESFLDYLRNEYSLSQLHEELFKKLLSNYPASVTKGNMKVEDRGKNTVILTSAAKRTI